MHLYQGVPSTMFIKSKVCIPTSEHTNNEMFTSFYPHVHNEVHLTCGLATIVLLSNR